MPRLGYGRCCYPGCVAHGGLRWIEQHVKQQHVRCTCGYVGVARGLGAHRGQVGRRLREAGGTFDPARHVIAAYLAPPED